MPMRRNVLLVCLRFRDVDFDVDQNPARQSARGYLTSNGRSKRDLTPTEDNEQPSSRKKQLKYSGAQGERGTRNGGMITCDWGRGKEGLRGYFLFRFTRGGSADRASNSMGAPAREGDGDGVAEADSAGKGSESSATSDVRLRPATAATGWSMPASAAPETDPNAGNGKGTEAAFLFARKRPSRTRQSQSPRQLTPPPSGRGKWRRV
ncbi:hypothetical protein H4582DRAFT_514087 [Lactarius indigo]|nr:hypothetical protein H4582DRAFT_514087 [Lactarius indigo]